MNQWDGVDVVQYRNELVLVVVVVMCFELRRHLSKTTTDWSDSLVPTFEHCGGRTDQLEPGDPHPCPRVE